MRDGYYYKSLITTLLLYCIALSGIIYAVYRTGMIGFIILLSLIAGFLCYFYGIFENRRSRGSENTTFEKTGK